MTNINIESLVEDIVKYKWGKQFSITDVLRTEKALLDMLNSLNDDDEPLATVTEISSRAFKVGDIVYIQTTRPETLDWNGLRAVVERDEKLEKSLWIRPLVNRPDGGRECFYWRKDELRKAKGYEDW